MSQDKPARRVNCPNCDGRGETLEDCGDGEGRHDWPNSCMACRGTGLVPRRWANTIRKELGTGKLHGNDGKQDYYS